MEDLKPFRFHTSASTIISGPSGSGKSSILYNILSNPEIFQKEFDSVVLFAPVIENKWRDLNTNLVSYNNLPTEEIIKDLENQTDSAVLIIDDFSLNIRDNKEASALIEKLFTVFKTKLDYINHIFYITHNIFFKSSFNKLIQLNSDYIILLRNPRGLDQLRTLGIQIFGKGKISQEFVNIYKEQVLQKVYSPLIINLNPQTSYAPSLHVDILSENQTVYLPY